MTPTWGWLVAALANEMAGVVSWFCVPNFFRSERPQRGRLREFWQWNVDIIGTPEEANNVAEAECVMVALDFLRFYRLSCAPPRARDAASAIAPFVVPFR